MEGYTILDYSTPLESDSSASVSNQLFLAQEQKRQLLDQLRFPGDDGGHSLASWARQDLEATLQLLADRTQYITGASGAAIALRDGEEIICRASSGPSAPEIGSLLHVNSGLSGESIRTREVRRCDDATTDSRVNHEICRSLGIASFAVMPLLRDGQVIGIIEVFSGLPHSFEDRDILALERMGEMVNTALDHVQNARTEAPLSKAIAAGVDGGGRVNATAKPRATETAVAPADGNGGASMTSENSVFPLQAGSAALLDAHKAIKLPGGSLEEMAGPKVLSLQERQALNEHGIATCNACGFPVSEGRSLCVDCETDSPAEELPPAFHSPAYAGAFSEPTAELTFGIDADEQQSGLKHWVGAHKYLLGMVAVSGSAVLLLLLR